MHRATFALTVNTYCYVIFKVVCVEVFAPADIPQAGAQQQVRVLAVFSLPWFHMRFEGKDRGPSATNECWGPRELNSSAVSQSDQTQVAVTSHTLPAGAYHMSTSRRDPTTAQPVALAPGDMQDRPSQPHPPSLLAPLCNWLVVAGTHHRGPVALALVVGCAFEHCASCLLAVVGQPQGVAELVTHRLSNVPVMTYRVAGYLGKAAGVQAPGFREAHSVQAQPPIVAMAEWMRRVYVSC